MVYVLPFDHPGAGELAVVGGKAANLAVLIAAGIEVPPGFTVTTDAYRDFLRAAGIDGRSPEELRTAILAAGLPADIADEIRERYRELGPGRFVAVRSSGTAEDLEGTSFAGLHDTFLDVRGEVDVLDAVRRCWASLWTARAVSYRDNHGIGSEVRMAVVVQVMVPSEVAGVMFTGNPLTGATDEVVINATWGLGEALVQGAVTPDQYTVQAPVQTSELRVIERIVGAKEHQVVRAVHGPGVATEVVPPADRERLTLDDAGVLELVRMGLAIQELYGGLPQDIEWALCEGRFHVVQARPITGVAFSWDAECERVPGHQDDPVDAVWTRAWADTLIPGVVSPLYYSIRWPKFSLRAHRRMFEVFGQPDVGEIRQFKYWKGEIYYNVAGEIEMVKRLVPPVLRPLVVEWIPPTMREEVLGAPFCWLAFGSFLMRWHQLDPNTTPYGYLEHYPSWRERSDIDGLPPERLRALSDVDLVAYCREMLEIEGQWDEVIWPSGFISMRLVPMALLAVLDAWYDQDAYATFGKLSGGSPRRTDTQRENSGLQALVQEICGSAVLSEAFAAHRDSEFFAHLETIPEGLEFLSRYRPWRDTFGHMGAADHDFLHPRRAEDPAVDYRAMQVTMAGTPGELDRREAELNAQREQTVAAVRAALRAQPDGEAKANLFGALHHLTLEYAMNRDNERHRPTERIIYSYRLGFAEIGRRLHERGLTDAERDYLFLTGGEVFDLFEGRTGRTPLLVAKIAGRGRNCDRMLAREADLPAYLRRNRPLDLDHPVEHGGDGRFAGNPTSSGVASGTAKVLMSHDELPRVGRGDILVTNSTDPGWNPVFAVISAVVVETGGILSHASCLAREYGFPAVHLPGATKLISDGATITVDGNTGTVTVDKEPA